MLCLADRHSTLPFFLVSPFLVSLTCMFCLSCPLPSLLFSLWVLPCCALFSPSNLLFFQFPLTSGRDNPQTKAPGPQHGVQQDALHDLNSVVALLTYHTPQPTPPASVHTVSQPTPPFALVSIACLLAPRCITAAPVRLVLFACLHPAAPRQLRLGVSCLLACILVHH